MIANTPQSLGHREFSENAETFANNTGSSNIGDEVDYSECVQY